MFWEVNSNVLSCEWFEIVTLFNHCTPVSNFKSPRLGLRMLFFEKAREAIRGLDVGVRCLAQEKQGLDARLLELELTEDDGR